MPEYISREAVIKEMSHMMSECFPEAVEELDAVITTVKEIPAADVVEVVRCGECKHLCVRSGALGVYQCAIHGDYPSVEYFCADGERENGGQDDV